MRKNQASIRYILFSLFFLSAFVAQLGAQNETTDMRKDKPQFKKEWAAIDSLKSLRQPKSALAAINELRTKIDGDQLLDQRIKALVYELGLNMEDQEQPYLIIVEKLRSEIAQSDGIEKAIKQSILAEFYTKFLQDYYWQLRDRTAVIGEQEEDLTSWSIAKIQDTIFYYYQQSLSEASLKTTATQEFEALLNPDRKNTEGLRPHLYDLLAFRALQYFINPRSYLNEPANAFAINDSSYFQLDQDFANLQLGDNGRRSKLFQAIKLMQELTQHYIDTKNIPALIQLEINRLQFIKNQGGVPNKDLHYKKALDQLALRHDFQKGSGPIYIAIGQQQQVEASLYNPLQSQDYKSANSKAYQTYQSVLEQLPNTWAASKAQQYIYDIEAQFANVETEEVIPPNTSALAKITYKNLSNLYLKLIKVDDKILKLFEEREPDVVFNQLRRKNAIRQWAEKLPNDQDFNAHSVETAFKGLEFGSYILMFSSDSNFKSGQGKVTNYVQFSVSNLGYFNRRDERSKQHFVVVDRKSGAPLEGVSVTALKNVYQRGNRRGYRINPIATRKTDENGFVSFPKIQSSYSIRLEKDKDQLYVPRSFYNGRVYGNPQAVVQTELFLDRKIYRPGQTVYFKGLTFQRDADQKSLQILANKEVEVIFRDANYQTIARQSFQTNDYGTFNGSFITPINVLTGVMTIEVAGTGNFTFNVEEYKRPKFEVKLNDLDGDYILGEEVLAQGKAQSFAGNALNNVKVSYRITRSELQPYPWYRYGYFRPNRGGQAVEIARGEISTDESGQFEIPFEAIPDLSIAKDRNPRFNFQIQVDVTDVTGETRSASNKLILAYTGMLAKVNLPEEVDGSAGELPVEIVTQNHNLQALAAEGQAKIYRLAAPQQVLIKRNWKRPDYSLLDSASFKKEFPLLPYQDEDKAHSWAQQEELWSYNFSTPKQSKTSIDLSNWEAGYYKMVIETQDARGAAVEFQQVFALYNAQKQSIPSNLAIWKSIPAITLEPGQNGKTFLANNGSPKYFLHEIEKSGKIVESKWYEVDGWLDIDNIIEEEDRGNIFYHLLSGYHNRAAHWSQRIRVPYTNKKLNFEYTTFRSNLKPGQEEEWTIKISGPDKDIVQAEFVATLYDKSLDAFRANQWAFSPYLEYSYTQSNWGKNLYSSISNQARYQEYLDGEKRIDKIFPKIDINPFISFYGGYGELAAYSSAPRSDRMATRSAAPVPKTYDAEEISVEMAAPASAEPPPPPPPPGEESILEKGAAAAQTAPLQIRKNLEETAFFFPNLYTDAEGNILLKFKMKEALTTWKFLGFGHTKDLKYGITEEEVVTQKELMISPNAPRFVRIGDQLSFTAKVSNLTERGMIGKASIDFLDANTLQSVNDQLGLRNTELDFKVGPGLSRGLSWSIRIPDGELDGLVYRVIAQADNYADGEEGMLPVLSNRILVTETMPLSVRQKESKTFDFEAMRSSLGSATAKAHQFKLEYTSNPAWLAVQALPYLMEYPHDCSEQLFNRLYANTLASHIIEQNPSVKATFESWKGSNAMRSNLSLNEDLKAIILEETPWVRDAQNEEEQRARMAMLFDLAKIQTEAATTIETLLARQSADGGLPWFSGGLDNSYISSYLLAGFGHLENLGAMDMTENSRVQRLTAGLIGFVDQSILEAYEKLLERVEKGSTKLEDDHLSRMVVQYLYARSFFLDTPFASEAVETAIRFYKNQAQQYWTKRSLQQQSQIGLFSHRMKMAELPQLIHQSLSERAINSEELGMYWDYDTGFYWYQAPIETHALMIEFFNIMEDYAAVNELKIWLLKNKQTNSWKTTKATAEAIYGLLQTTDGSAMLGESALAEVQFPDLKKKDYATKIENAQADAQAGTGYFSSSWKADEIQTALSSVKIKNNNKVVSWGAAYFQYFEDLDAVKTFEDTPLQLNKKLFKQVIGDNGPELIPINEQSRLQAGDLLKVRIELSVDRDMEFVHLKDMRASGLEPVNVLSTYKWQGGLGYYESTKDVATHFFMDYLPKGDYVFEYPLRVQLAGVFSNGISTIQSMYAPEFSSHSEGVILNIEE